MHPATKSRTIQTTIQFSALIIKRVLQSFTGYIVFDLETQNIFQEVNSSDPAALDISVATVYDSETDKYTTVTIDELETLWPILEQADALV